MCNMCSITYAACIVCAEKAMTKTVAVRGTFQRAGAGGRPVLVDRQAKITSELLTGKVTSTVRRDSSVRGSHIVLCLKVFFSAEPYVVTGGFRESAPSYYRTGFCCMVWVR